MKSTLPPIRHNVFLAVSHSPFLELLTLQKGPIVPLSAMTPLLGRNGRFEGTRRRCACSSPAVRCQSPGSVNRCLPFAAWRLVLAILFGRCRLPLASRLCRSLLAASPWHLLLSVRVALSAAFCGRLPFPPIVVCRTSAAPRAALTPLKHTLHFAVTCVSRS